MFSAAGTSSTRSTSPANRINLRKTLDQVRVFLSRFRTASAMVDIVVGATATVSRITTASSSSTSTSSSFSLKLQASLWNASDVAVFILSDFISNGSFYTNMQTSKRTAWSAFQHHVIIVHGTLTVPFYELLSVLGREHAFQHHFGHVNSAPKVRFSKQVLVLSGAASSKWPNVHCTNSRIKGKSNLQRTEKYRETIHTTLG